MSLQNIDKFNGLILIAFIFVIFLYSLIPINDYDFWWHLKTGDYILEHNLLPDSDPFLYTSLKHDINASGRTEFILKQYWIGQIIYSLVVEFFRFRGFIIMRGLVFALIALFSLLLAKHYKINFLSSIPFFLFALVTTECLTDRPQMFSFLFAIMTFYFLERGTEEKKYLFLIPPLMFLWSNVHGGYLVGIIFLAVYLAAIPFEERLKNVKNPLILIVFLSIILTYLNPNHWNAIKETFRFSDTELLYKTNLEYLSPITIIHSAIGSLGWLSYWLLILLTVVSSVYFFSVGSWSRIIILMGTAVASLLSIRYTYFFAPVVVPLASMALGSVFRERLKIYLPMVLINVALLAVLFFRVDFKSLLKYDTVYGYFPQHAAEYIISNKIPKPIFNDVKWGGYLTWRLWPEYKVFLDTRMLDADVFKQYISIVNDYDRRGRLILDTYSIKSIITPAINPYTGEILPFIKELYNDKEWAVVYFDGVAIIFVRNHYTKERFPKDSVYKEILLEVKTWYPVFPDADGYRKTIAEAYKILNEK